jgi:hypothetical protein
MPATLPSRAIYSIDPSVLRQFNALFAPRERSRVVERLMLTELASRQQSVLDAIRKIETDPRCASIAQVSSDMDALAGEVW